MSEKVSGRSSASRMWSITWPVLDHRADGREGRPGDEVGLHGATGRLLGIFEIALKRGTIDRGDLRQDRLPRLFVQALQDVSGIIRLELGDGLGHRGVRQIPQ